MSVQTIQMTDELHQYLIANSLRESEVGRKLREETRNMELYNMQIAPEQGQFMALLAELIGARRAIELGTFTGYSALCVASVLPSDGELICCDVSEEYTSVARRYWAEAGVADRIDLRLAPALETLDALIAEGRGEQFDFVFIDADKEPYDTYYERCLTLLRPGGLIALDNALCDGNVLDPQNHSEAVQAVDALNRKVHADERVSVSLVPIGDGVLLAKKR
jgi:predicted O-methyltransferase YrrM